MRAIIFFITIIALCLKICIGYCGEYEIIGRDGEKVVLTNQNHFLFPKIRFEDEQYAFNAGDTISIKGKMHYSREKRQYQVLVYSVDERATKIIKTFMLNNYYPELEGEYVEVSGRIRELDHWQGVYLMEDTDCRRIDLGLEEIYDACRKSIEDNLDGFIYTISTNPEARRWFTVNGSVYKEEDFVSAITGPMDKNVLYDFRADKAICKFLGAGKKSGNKNNYISLSLECLYNAGTNSVEEILVRTE